MVVRLEAADAEVCLSLDDSLFESNLNAARKSIHLTLIIVSKSVMFCSPNFLTCDDEFTIAFFIKCFFV